MTRLCDAAGIAVPLARFGWQKRALCDWYLRCAATGLGAQSSGLEESPLSLGCSRARFLQRLAVDRSAGSADDRDKLMVDASFLDRLRGTGHLDPSLAASHGALGPVGRVQAATTMLADAATTAT